METHPNGADVVVRDDTDSGIDRRTLIKGAAAAGVAAWTAPVVIDSLAAPVGAQNGTPAAGCFKYMFDWCWASEVQACVDSGDISSQFNQNDAMECAQNTGESQAGQVQPDPNCCQTGTDEEDWNQQPDLVGCVTRTGDACTCPSPGENLSVTFTVTCPDCYFADIEVAYLNEPGDCTTITVTGSSGSEFTRSWTITFANDKEPVWFKFWAACNLSVCSPQTVPCTQSACLPGADCVNGTGDEPGPCASKTLAIT
jgi:hypothetical protein